MHRYNTIVGLLVAGTVAAGVGCKERAAGWQPNSEASLRKTPSELKANARARFPYPSDAPRGGDLRARAEIGYMWNVINLVNYSQQTWTDCEVWVTAVGTSAQAGNNQPSAAEQQYVVFLPKIEPNKAVRIGFKLLYNEKGEHLPEDGAMISKIELKKDGTLYDVSKQLGG